MHRHNHAYLMGVSLLALASAAPALGQERPAAATPAAQGGSPSNSLGEIIVTAQKREQNIQDVPIAVTALTPAALAVNRVVTVSDLNLLAPGFTVTPAAGGTQIPTFNMRGITSYGVVPGSDKAISIYLDGVYLGGTRGSIFDLPDVSQIEVLRGPQGTLFGRNAIGGALSVNTRDPSGVFGIQQDFTGGNEDQFRSRTSIDLPSWGPFSAYFTYVHNYQRGDIENEGAGTVWNYSNATSSIVPKTEVSPKWLGTIDTNSVFVAVEYAPTDRFSTIYKFDYSQNDGTPNGVSFLGADPIGTGVISSLILAEQPKPVRQASAQRPEMVNNDFTVPMRQNNQGHSLTSKYEGDYFTIKNIAAYRQSYIFSSDELDGVGGLVFPQGLAPFIPLLQAALPNITPAAVGKPFTLLGITSLVRSRQWSDELQFNYHSKFVTFTSGGLVYLGKDVSGGVPGLPSNIAFTPTPNGLIPAGTAFFNNKASSIAAYTQVEVHATSQLDVVGGMRETKDWKSGSAILAPALSTPNFKYVNTKPSYLIGLNYKPTRDILVYGKYSTAFVSGGNVGGIPFQAETVDSWEAGVKAEFFDRRVRTNVSLYDATYQHLQDAEGGSTYTGTLVKQYPFIPLIATFIVDQGGQVKSKGVEFEGTVLVAHGLTAGTNVSYADNTFHDVNPSVDIPAGVPPVPTLLPKYTVGLWSQYQKTFGNNMRATVRLDANWRSTIFIANPNLGIPAYANYLTVPSTWLVSGRATLGGFKLGPTDAEVSIWVKNLTDDRSLTYALLIPTLVGAGNYQAARTFGLDLHIKYH